MGGNRALPPLIRVGKRQTNVDSLEEQLVMVSRCHGNQPLTGTAQTENLGRFKAMRI